MSDLTDLAAEICTAWGPLAQAPKLIVNRENAVFEVHLASGARGALRLHRVGYQTADSILSELRWTERLAEVGFACPVPLRTSDGALTVQVDGAPMASMIGWIDAEPIADINNEDGPEPPLYHAVGALIGELHNRTDEIDQAGITRPFWSRETLLGETPIWGCFWDNPALTSEERALLQDARAKADEALSSLSEPDIGLIHADLLQENILHRDGALWLIDFDDAGFGYRLYDLGTALIQHVYDPRYAAFCDALRRGYEEAREVEVRHEDLQLFTLLRGFASCGWIISRAAADDPIHRAYADRAVMLAREFIG